VILLSSWDYDCERLPQIGTFVVVYLFCFRFFEIRSYHVAQAGLELTSCLAQTGFELVITGVSHHTWPSGSFK
jgi:hypothetical protein